MIQTALLRFKKELELENLRQSAKLYAEIYDEDNELLKEFSEWESASDEDFFKFKDMINPSTAMVKDSDMSQSVEQFLEKWTGFIKDIDPDKNKLEYLENLK